MSTPRDPTATILRGLFDSTPDAVALLDGNGRIVLVNDRVEEVFGYAREELPGRAIEMLLPDLRRREHRAHRQRHPMRTGLELAGRRKDGTRVPVQVGFSPLPSENGLVVICVIRDVSRRKAAEAALRILLDVGQALGGALDCKAAAATVARVAVPEMADWCMIDLGGEDGAFRRVAVAHADPGRDALAGQLRGFAPDPSRPHEARTALRTGRPRLVPELSDAWLVAHARDAQHLAALRALGARALMCLPLNAGDRTLGALTLVAAESGRRYGAADLALAEALARRAAVAVANARLFREAREATRRRDAFLARAGHELRTPLTVIKGHLALAAKRLSARRADTDLRDLLSVARRHADRTVQLLSDLIDVSRLAAGREPLDVKPLKLGGVVAEAVAQAAPLAAEKNVRLVTVVPPRLALAADRLKLEQVVVNLLTNAIKHTPPGRTVRIEGVPAGSDLELRVRDNGAGIAHEDLERIFLPFHQVDRTAEAAKAARHGAGLGLAIVKGLVELHGGRVWAESDGPGRGSVFVVRLPASTARVSAA